MQSNMQVTALIETGSSPIKMTIVSTFARTFSEFRWSPEWLQQVSTEVSNFESWTNPTKEPQPGVVVERRLLMLVWMMWRAHRKPRECLSVPCCVKCPHQKRRGTASDSQTKQNKNIV
eukprot:1619274-Amphidinium_carterae.7